MSLLPRIRYYILSFSTVLAVLIFLFVTQTIPSSTLQTIRLTEIFALTALTFLYLSLLISPLTLAFPQLPGKVYLIRSRRALGVSSFFFGLIHACYAFFGLLGGFPGLGFLSSKYIIAITLSFTALCILALLAATSFDVLERALGRKWKFIHRFVYLAGVLIVIHALMLGTQFSDLSAAIPQIFFGLLLVLLVLEARRFDRYIQAKVQRPPSFGWTFVIVSVLLGVGVYWLIGPTSNTNSLGIHAAHIKLAQQAAQQSSSTSNIPGLNGDRSKRYTASFLPPATISPNTDTPLTFRIYDAGTGDRVSLFNVLYAYPMHMIVVDSTLSYFEHTHPVEQGNGDFAINTKFPTSGVYHIYIQFQPLGGIEQQMGFNVVVGTKPNPVPPSTQPVDTQLTKTFGDYDVTLNTHGVLRAADMTLGQDTISFTIADAKTKKPITTLKPLLGSFGHLTMINEQTYEFIHVHPSSVVTPPPDANGGPTVDFLPIGIYGPFKSGIYRAFAEFSIKTGTKFDAAFTLKVE